MVSSRRHAVRLPSWYPSMSDGSVSCRFLSQIFPQDFIIKKKDYLQTQVGNPEGPDKPNKKVCLSRRT